MPDGEANEQLLRVVLYEDVKEYLFSLISSEARLSLIYQLIEFFSGKIYSRYILFLCTTLFIVVFSLKTTALIFIYIYIYNYVLYFVLEYVNCIDIF